VPYIKQTDRDRLELPGDLAIETPGELNYLVTMLAKRYLERHGRSYATINAIVGALECAKAEFYRRVAAPYEDAKAAEHGDVFDDRR
jgi:uncharacterized protein DUF6899